MSEANASTTKPTAAEAPRARRRAMQGVVKSDKMDKTITVEVTRRVKHPLYEKFINRRTRVHAHDEANEAKIGDIVQISETRPISKLKRFRLVKIVTKAVGD